MAEYLARDSVQLNEWRQLEYHDPATVLRKLRVAEDRLHALQMPDDIRNLRTNTLKELREGRDAALFSLGASTVLGVPVGFARHEATDYDFVLTTRIGDVQHFSPIQLKEWVPPDLNPEQTLDDILQSIPRRYPRSPRTTIAIRIYRPIRLELESVEAPHATVDGVWLFGCCASDQSEWFVYGNLLTQPRLYRFLYPEPAGNSAA